MTKARLDGIYLLVLGSLIFIALGAALSRTIPAPLLDFRALYYPARCLLHGNDPYKETDVMRIYSKEGAYRQLDTEKERQMVTRFVYMPTAFPVTVPFAMLPWGPAYLLWIILTAGSLIVASFLIWGFGADYAPVISGSMIGFLLANNELFIVKGMCAGIAISFCAIAVWCFVRERFIAIGILCFAISLAVKPQDTGLVWLYFLLAGGIYRKRALQTLFATAVGSMPAVIWVWRVTPHWIQELHSNILAFAVHGGLNDPGLASSGAHGLSMIISLQAVFSVFWDNPNVYNPASYLVIAPLLLLWMITILRTRSSPDKAWLAIAAVAAISMLPIYHRQYDAKLLLLTVPACAMLWAERGLLGWLALLVNGAGFVLTGELPWAVFFAFASHLHLPQSVLTAVQVFPVPLMLLVMSVFYLWIFVRRGCTTPQPRESHTKD